MKIELKENNTPTQTGFYLCLNKNWNKTRPTLVDIRVLEFGGEMELQWVSDGAAFPLSKLEGECLWSDEILFD